MYNFVDQTKFTSGQLQIARNLAAGEVKGRFPAGGNPSIASFVYKRTGEIAKELFGQNQEQPKQAAPAPAPAPTAPASNPAAEQLAELTAQSEAYRKEAEAAIAAGKERVAQLEDEEIQRQKAIELQNRLAIQSAASTARGQMGAQLKIAPASSTASTAGTAAFKRRRDRMSIAPIQSTAGINVPSGNVLNV